jgi:hypothetical protein
MVNEILPSEPKQKLWHGGHSCGTTAAARLGGPAELAYGAAGDGFLRRRKIAPAPRKGLNPGTR